ncbi:MAG TPA: GntR family transcriptional regulator [Acidimicrobiia bacterium]|nr:GntR family transcriptional regulator [Acidimicrobiia bacterium]
MTTDDIFRLDASTSRRITAVDLVRDALRAAILRGDLSGGSRLVQTEIANQLSVSTTPVREAMRDLASEGLITLDSHRIGTVRKPDWDEMVEITAIRRALEDFAIAKAMANITSSQLDAAKALAEDLSREDDLGSWVQKNSQFHSIFHQATGTKRLGTMLQALEEAGGLFVAQAQRLHPEIRRRAIADHFALLEAYEAQDLDGAVEIQLAHIGLPLEGAELNANQAG